MDAFISYIKQHIFLSENAENEIRSMLLVEEFSKGDLLLEEGKTCNRQYFLIEGTIRAYLYIKGKDVTQWIYPELSLFTSWHSYILKKPSAEYLEATEATEVVSLTYDQWQELYTRYPKLNHFSRVIFEEQLALIDDFYKGYYFLSAKEKYELLLNVYPSIIQRANLGHIASMLGISQETLSRIRAK